MSKVVSEGLTICEVFCGFKIKLTVLNYDRRFFWFKQKDRLHELWLFQGVRGEHFTDCSSIAALFISRESAEIAIERLRRNDVPLELLALEFNTWDLDGRCIENFKVDTRKGPYYAKRVHDYVEGLKELEDSLANAGIIRMSIATDTLKTTVKETSK